MTTVTEYTDAQFLTEARQRAIDKLENQIQEIRDVVHNWDAVE